MGYTHYWKHEGPLDQQAWDLFIADARKILEHPNTAKLVQFESDDDRPPQIDSDIVRFNGIGEEAHETFAIDRTGTGWDFCKTRFIGYKKYDIVVTAVLILAGRHFGDAIRISSDGDWSDWQDGRDLYSHVFGEVPPNPLEHE